MNQQFLNMIMAKPWLSFFHHLKMKASDRDIIFKMLENVTTVDIMILLFYYSLAWYCLIMFCFVFILYLYVVIVLCCHFIAACARLQNLCNWSSQTTKLFWRCHRVDGWKVFCTRIGWYEWWKIMLSKNIKILLLILP